MFDLLKMFDLQTFRPAKRARSQISGGPQRSVCSSPLFPLIVLFSVMISINFIPSELLKSVDV